MQFVHSVHVGQISRRDGLRLVIEAAAADPEPLSLPAERQGMRVVNHRLALANSPALPSALPENPWPG
jgi:hypothetical protein